jgi:hypothetical protein
LHQLMWDHAVLCTDRFSEDEQQNYTTFTENQKYKYGGRLSVEIHVLFYRDKS